MFWGEILKDEEIVNLKSNRMRVLHISHATLVRRSDKDKICIQLNDGKTNYVIGKLVSNLNEFINLDINLNLDKSSTYSLSLINGNNTEVHITGYFEKNEESIVEELEEVIIKNTINENIPTQDEFKEESVKNTIFEIQPNDEEVKEEKESLNIKERKYESEEEINEEIDKGVDNNKLNQFLNRKISKQDELSGKKLKKLDPVSPKIPIIENKQKASNKNNKIPDKPIINKAFKPNSYPSQQFKPKIQNKSK